MSFIAMASLDTSLFLVTMHNSHFTNVTSEFAFGNHLRMASRYRKMFTASKTLTRTKRNCNEEDTEIRQLPDSLGNQASGGLDRVW